MLQEKNENSILKLKIEQLEKENKFYREQLNQFRKNNDKTTEQIDAKLQEIYAKYDQLLKEK